MISDTLGIKESNYLVVYTLKKSKCIDNVFFRGTFFCINLSKTNWRTIVPALNFDPDLSESPAFAGWSLKQLLNPLIIHFTACNEAQGAFSS